ncbi:MAG: metallophosphoesterase [Myxococcaceae bacterium]
MKRLSGLFLAGLFAALTTGCPDKKVEPPKPVEPPKEVKAPPAAPKENEPRALKECAAGLELGPAQDLKFGERAAKLAGYKLSFTDKDADGALVLGLLGPINEDSGENMVALKKYVKYFQDEKADAIVVTGDSGEPAAGIARALSVLAESKLPVLVVIGNRECRAEYTDGVNAARKNYPNVINLNEVRAVEWPELTLVSLPGYHDPAFISCANGCQYFKSTLAEVVQMSKDSKAPVMLVAHGPPHGNGELALDYASVGQNVGDDNINKTITEASIAFGAFSNIKEAGGRASADPAGTQLVKEGVASKNLYVAMGPADTIGWPMNDGTNNVGMAGTLTIKEGQGTYKILRLKALTAAEKAEAKKLEPAKAPEPKEEAAPEKKEEPKKP